ncbi:hypothetical protein [Vibrio phage vB_VhaS-tm]|nr:hypothetical protein [Vibrio phage vB_VhaS-tm]
MARLRRTNAIKRPRKKFFTASNFSPRFQWWWAQQDDKWRDDAEPVPSTAYTVPEMKLRPSIALPPVKPQVGYLPGLGVWDDDALWSDNAIWRD